MNPIGCARPQKELSPSGVISFLTGYPARLWEKKLLVMFQAFIDDSQSQKGDRRYYLVAYVNFASEWEHFIRDWDAELAASPSISNLHTVDANALIGEFGGWTREKRNQKLVSLAKVISQHEPWVFSVSVSQKEFDEIFKPVAPYNLQNPYFMCFYSMIDGIARFHKENGIEHPVSFVFDEQGSLGVEAVQWFEHIRDMHPSLKPLLKTTPIFQDDEVVVPLQAADMLAWHIRRESDNPDEKLPAMKYLFPHNVYVERTIGKKYLEDMAGKLAATPGIKSMSQKKQWKSVKSEIHDMLARGVRPIPIRRDNFLKRAGKFLARFFSSKFFGGGDKS